MAELLFIEASPRIERSHSIAVARAFVEAYQRANPDDTVRRVNLFEADLPEFNLTAANARYKVMHGKEQSDDERRAWEAVIGEIDRFKAADKYLLATPMWNFSIPWRLKQFFDIVVQPGLTFTVGENGYEGLVAGRPAVVVYARGNIYEPGTPGEADDNQKPYVEQILAFMGITEVQSILVNPTLAQGPEAARQAQEAAIARAVELAERF